MFFLRLTTVWLTATAAAFFTGSQRKNQCCFVARQQRHQPSNYQPFTDNNSRAQANYLLLIVGGCCLLFGTTKNWLLCSGFCLNFYAVPKSVQTIPIFFAAFLVVAFNLWFLDFAATQKPNTICPLLPQFMAIALSQADNNKLASKPLQAMADWHWQLLLQ